MLAWWRRRRRHRPRSSVLVLARRRAGASRSYAGALDGLRPIAERLGGDERSLLRGPGLELAEVREYQPGDDVRRSTGTRPPAPDVPMCARRRPSGRWTPGCWSTSAPRSTGARPPASSAAARPSSSPPSGSCSGGTAPARRDLLRATARSDVLAAGCPAGPPAAAAGPAARDAGAGSRAGRPTCRRADLCRSVIRRRSVVVLVSDFLVDDGWATRWAGWPPGTRWWCCACRPARG